MGNLKQNSLVRATKSAETVNGRLTAVKAKGHDTRADRSLAEAGDLISPQQVSRSRQEIEGSAREGELCSAVPKSARCEN